MTKLKTPVLPLLALALVGGASYTAGQTTPVTPRTATTPTTQTAPVPATPERQLAAPQVVTVIHRLNAIKVLRLLLRSGAVGALDSMDEAFSMSTEVHTNILAGLALEDGETIAVWLPEAEVEVDTWGFAKPANPPLPPLRTPPRVATPGSMELTSDLTVTPELMIIGRDGKHHPARYVGLDGITGLSLLKISNQSVSGDTGTRVATIAVKQRVRLFAPEPVPEGRSSTSNTISVRLGETAGTIDSLRRGPAGEINRVKVLSVKLSTASVGGIVVDDAGQTIGIVTSIEGNEAFILPPAVIQGAAQRVIARKGSVPRPWLGISGELLAFTPFEGMVQRGWSPDRAALLKNQSGILLTSITAGSPAELAALHAGDVIVRVNDNEIKSADDFSLLLGAAGEKPVLFTVVRPNHPEPESISIRLSTVFDSPSTLSALPGLGPRSLLINPLIKQGIETFPLRPAAAARLNATGGLLVIYVQPQSPAFRAGLQATDVIEAVNGQPVLKTGRQQLEALTGTSYTLNIVRDKQKIALAVDASTP